MQVLTVVTNVNARVLRAASEVTAERHHYQKRLPQFRVDGGYIPWTVALACITFALEHTGVYDDKQLLRSLQRRLTRPIAHETC